MAERGRIRIGIGGWTYDPWRTTFYPKDVKRKDELAYASRQITAIEINGTYYRTQAATSFVKWHDETPNDFVFSMKASRYATNRKVLAEAGSSIERFVTSGIAALGPKLGPIVWQLSSAKSFDAADVEAFLALLPQKIDGLRLRHAIDARHKSFMNPDFVALARRHNVAIVCTDSADFPCCADLTADFVYVRLMSAQASIETGYPAPQLDTWAQRARIWASGGDPDDLPHVDSAKASAQPRDVFMFVINGAKERAPAAARALIERVKNRGEGLGVGGEGLGVGGEGPKNRRRDEPTG